MIVMKFGGSSVGSKNKILTVASIVRSELARKPVVVVSACGSTTDMLIQAAKMAAEGEADAEKVERYTLSLVEDLGIDSRAVEPLLHQLSMLLTGISLIRELTPRTLDQVMSFGERMSTRIVAMAMESEGVPAQAVNAYDLGLITDSRHGEASPLPNIEEGIAREIAKIGLVPVVTGFLGKDEKGNITTLGRGGSDFSASIIGAAIGASEVQIWTDVNGVMTCDPSINSAAQNLEALSFEEASELAYYGAEVLHPSTLVPAIRKKIPVCVRNTMNPKDRGTRILAEAVTTDRIAKSVVYKENVCLIQMSSARLLSAVELLASAFKILSQNRIGVHMVATSESTVSMVTDKDYEDNVLEKARKELAAFGDVEIERGKAIVCVVGEEIRGKEHVLDKVFGALAQKKIKPRMVSQSSSEINIAFLLSDNEIEPAVNALHGILVR